MTKYLDVKDLSFQYGIGIFDTVLVNKSGKVFLLERHIDRLINSLNVLNFDFDFNKEDLIKKIREYIDANEIFNKILRTTITYGNPQKCRKPNVFINHRDNYTFNRKSEFKLCKALSRKNESSLLVRHKTTNYMENYIENSRAVKLKFDDAFFINSSGLITETTRSNLFYVKDGVMHTPVVLSGLLPGIIREWLIEFAKKDNIKVLEGKYKLDSLYKADEVFITNSVIGIRSVTQVDNIKYSLEKAYIANKLQKSYEQLFT